MSYPAEAMVRGQHVGGSGGFHGCGGGGRRRRGQAWPGPLLKSWLGQPHLGGARFHHGFTSENYKRKKNLQEKHLNEDKTQTPVGSVILKIEITKPLLRNSTALPNLNGVCRG